MGEWLYLAVYPLHGPGHDRSVGELMYLTVCSLRGPRHDSSVGEWMHLAVCPPCGPGHDSSVGEWMNLAVYTPRGLGHDISVGEWIYLTVCPRSPWSGLNSQPWRSISMDFSLVNHTLPARPESAWQKMAQSPPQWHRTTCGHQGGRPKFNRGQTMVENNNKINAHNS